MSSILDALERASQKRSDLLPPKATDAGTVPAIRTRRGLWFMLGVSLVLAVLIGYGLLPKPKPVRDEVALVQKATPAAGEVASIQDVSPQPEPAPDQPPPRIVVPDLQSRLRDTGQPSRQSLIDKARVTAAASPVRVEDPVAATEAEIDARPESIVETPIRATPSPSRETPEVSSVSPGEMPLRVTEPAPDALSEPSTPAKLETTRETAPGGGAGAIPLVWELPQAEREALLELSISIHVYHQDPKRRFVLINMHRYVEGDRLKEKGYRLVRIDPDGIVLDYGEGLVRIPRS
jgi:general secretion pathway protein B